MDIIFSEFCLKILPLYVIIVLGFLAGKSAIIDRKSIASILFYAVIPFVYFDFANKTEFEVKHLALPFVVMTISFTLSLTFLYLSKLIWQKDARPNVIAFSAGTANTGYFGLPVALLLFDEQTVGIFMLINVGLSLYDYTIGAYVIALGRFTYRDALIQVSKLPIIYAFVLGIITNELGFNMPCEFNVLADNMLGTYIVMGLMIVGLGLSSIRSFGINLAFLGVLLSARFIATPMLIMILILIDQKYLYLFDQPTHLALMLYAFMPPAANTVVFASLYECHPEETSTAILVGTLIAMFYIPLAISLFF